MYSDKYNINKLTALLLAHGITKAIVCPGSRNAPIVHNIHEAGIDCTGITDERCAGFYALGMAEATDTPVAVCVTSGSALLNLAPAVAEAYYRHLPLLIISADRPAHQIGQLQGQTLPQPGALGIFVKRCVDLPEPHDAATRAYCNRLVNEALDALHTLPLAPVHINVPITEPLFNFTTPTLPEERVIRRLSPQSCPAELASKIAERLRQAERPLIVFGQCSDSPMIKKAVDTLRAQEAVVGEPLCPGFTGADLDAALARLDAAACAKPTFILYVGDTLVSKSLKKYLASAKSAEVCAINHDRSIHDVFGNLTEVIDCDIPQFLSALAAYYTRYKRHVTNKYAEEWNGCIYQALPPMPMAYSEAMAVDLLEKTLDGHEGAAVHYANSQSVRLGCMYATGYIHVNRGVNGIEGAISTAAGYSIASRRTTYCIAGDLSFLYDSNALWCSRLNRDLRILLLNNSRGKIFDTLPGLSESGAFDPYVCASHSASAEGICKAYNATYLRADDAESLMKGIRQLVSSRSKWPVVLECIFA